jgi:hypothetical protein
MKAFLRSDVGLAILCAIVGAATTIAFFAAVNRFLPTKPLKPPVHHMIALVHYDDKMVCYIDNNDPPGTYRHVPTTEFKQRYVDDGSWATVYPKAVTLDGPGLYGWADPSKLKPKDLPWGGAAD